MTPEDGSPPANGQALDRATTNPPGTPRPFGPLKTIVFSLIPLLVLSAVVETGFRVREIVYPPFRADYGLGFDEGSRVFTPRLGSYRTRSSKLVSFNRESFARRKPANECRVFMIGGSNVNYLKPMFPAYEERISQMLDGECTVNLINVGGLAYGSQRLLRIAFELMDYEPDLLVIYAGHNEFEELQQLTLVEMDNVPLQRVVYRSAAVRYFRDRAVMRDLDTLQLEENRELLGNPQVDYMATAGRDFTQEEIDDRMRRYEDHLDRIISLYREQGVPVVIGTVATNYWAPHFPMDKRDIQDEITRLYEEGRYEEGLALARAELRVSTRHQASDAENEIILRLAEKHGIPLADVSGAIKAAEPNGVPGETLLSDRCHVNEEGKVILMDTYAPLVAEALRERMATEHGG